MRGLCARPADVFAQVKTRAKDQTQSMRIRSLLMDLVDLRKSGWDKGSTPKSMAPEGPMLLSEVHKQWQDDHNISGGGSKLGRTVSFAGNKPTPNEDQDGWETVERPSSCKVARGKVAVPPPLSARSVSAPLPKTAA